MTFHRITSKMQSNPNPQAIDMAQTLYARMMEQPGARRFPSHTLMHERLRASIINDEKGFRQIMLDGHSDTRNLVTCADAKMYQTKQSGLNRCIIDSAATV